MQEKILSSWQFKQNAQGYVMPSCAQSVPALRAPLKMNWRPTQAERAPVPINFCYLSLRAGALIHQVSNGLITETALGRKAYLTGAAVGIAVLTIVRNGLIEVAQGRLV